MKRYFILLCLLCITIVASAYKQLTVNVKVNGTTRSMVVFVPNNVVDNLPLMIITHGMNQNPEYQYDADKIYQMVDTEKFIVAYLRSNGSTWDTGGTNDQKFVENTIVELYRKYAIDRHRVYWSGFSMGSMLIYHSMHNMQGKIAAFAPTSGIQFGETPWTKCKKPVNLIHCHSNDDEVFNINGNPGQYSYTIRDYVLNMAKMNKFTKNSKQTNYSPSGCWNVGTMETWTNDNGNVVKFFTYNGGGHCPLQGNGKEIWKFCKQFSLSDEELDPLPEVKEYTYSVSDADEYKNGSMLSGKTFLVTDADKQMLLYNNTGLESPQNTRNGDFSIMAENDYCYMKFTKVTNASSTVKDNLYNIQMANAKGENYSLWSDAGYLNTPPGEWCLFALGLKNQNGQDEKNYGLWQVSYEEGLGFTIRNVGAMEAGHENTYLTPAAETPVAEKSYVRLFTKVTQTVVTDVEPIVYDAAPHCADNKARDLTGRTISSFAQYKGVYIMNGKKYAR